MPKAIKESDVRPDLLEHFPEAANRVYIYCPGCYEASKLKHPDDSGWWLNSALHCFSTKVHQFNGDMDRPTLSPSLLHNYENGTTGERYCCHSFVRDGQIQFLGDCTHPLVNQTVELMDVPEMKKGQPNV